MKQESVPPFLGIVGLRFWIWATQNFAGVKQMTNMRYAVEQDHVKRDCLSENFLNKETKSRGKSKSGIPA